MKEYSEDEFLLLSGIQHFCFCRRQWALIHIEQQWQENLQTTEGNIVHKYCHDENLYEKRKDLIITRGMKVFSRKLGVTGACDVVELHRSIDGAVIAGQTGAWQPCPVEYKKGKCKSIDADRLQLCCQAMCLEEMFLTPIAIGYLFYAETHRREEVAFTDTMKKQVAEMLREMHSLFAKGYTPKSKPKAGCSSCSLKEICLPKLCNTISLSCYYERFLGE